MADDDVTLTPAAQETSATETSEPAQPDTAPEAATPSEHGVQGEAPAQAEQPTKQTDGSLTPPNPVAASKPAEQTPAENPWEKRYRDLMSYTDRRTNEWKQRMEQQGQQMAELQKFKQEQEQRAKAASLKPWSKAHPEYAKFGGLLERAKVVDQQMRRIPANLPPEQQEAMKQAIVGALSPDEQMQIQEYRESLQNFQKDFFTDPHGTLMPMVEQLAERKVQEALTQINIKQEIDRDFESPELKPLIQKYSQDFEKALSDGVPYSYATHMMKMHAQMEEMQNQIKGLSGKASQAEEQRRLAKGEAAITRDPRTPPKDPYDLAKAEAQKRGISTSSKQFMDILTKYTK
jgi:hypothetical protein